MTIPGEIVALFITLLFAFIFFVIGYCVGYGNGKKYSDYEKYNNFLK